VSPELVRRLVREELQKLLQGAQVLTDVVHSDSQALRGAGLGDQNLEADLAGQYGVYSRAPDGGDAVVLLLGGEANSAIVIGYRFRMAEFGLQKGEIALGDDQGQRVHLKRDGIYLDSSKVAIAGPGAAAARQGDPVNLTPELAAFFVQLVSAIQALGGTATDFAHAQIGTIAGGSSKVTIG